MAKKRCIEEPKKMFPEKLFVPENTYDEDFDMEAMTEIPAYTTMKVAVHAGVYVNDSRIYVAEYVLNRIVYVGAVMSMIGDAIKPLDNDVKILKKTRDELEELLRSDGED